MLTGVLLSLLTVVLGGYGWFLILVVFFALGGLASKFRYEEKVSRGVAEDRGGARGSHARSGTRLEYPRPASRDVRSAQTPSDPGVLEREPLGVPSDVRV
jgi:hypothetical protein